MSCYSNEDEANPRIILVMGETGVGKSYFIKEISGRNDRVDCSLNPQPNVTEVVECEILGQTIFLLDTPGFDDIYRSDTEILAEITSVLSHLYGVAGCKICGVIYIHRIDEERMEGTNIKDMMMFKKICGEDSLSNVVLLTNRWNSVDYETGLLREKELKDGYWKNLISLGCKVERYANEQDIIRIFKYLLQKDEVVLDIQREMVDEGKMLEDTSAAGIVNEEISTVKEQCRQEIKNCANMIMELRNEGSKLMDLMQNINMDFLKKTERLEKDVQILRQRFDSKSKNLIKNAMDGLSKVAIIKSVLRSL